jgi:hypothetical protein
MSEEMLKLSAMAEHEDVPRAVAETPWLRRSPGESVDVARTFSLALQLALAWKVQTALPKTPEEAL